MENKNVFQFFANNHLRNWDVFQIIYTVRYPAIRISGNISDIKPDILSIFS